MSTEETQENRDHSPENPPKEDVFLQPEPPELTAKEKMLQEEKKFKSKYPNMKPGGGSALLAKRLQKNKYFDSGEYNMQKAKMKSSVLPPPAQEKSIMSETSGEAIPTPETIAAMRKPSLVHSKLVNYS